MFRRSRGESEHAGYHVTARANDRRRIFRTDEDREMLLQPLAQTAAPHEAVGHGLGLRPTLMRLTQRRSEEKALRERIDPPRSRPHS